MVKAFFRGTPSSERHFSSDNNPQFESIIDIPNYCEFEHITSAFKFMSLMGYDTFRGNNGKQVGHIAGLFLCTSCHHFIVVDYLVDDYDTNTLIMDYDYQFGNIDFPFNKIIEKVSPKFREIYSQASRAENLGLNEITGLGYRKALEFFNKRLFDQCTK